MTIDAGLIPGLTVLFLVSVFVLVPDSLSLQFYSDLGCDNITTKSVLSAQDCFDSSQSLSLHANFVFTQFYKRYNQNFMVIALNLQISFGNQDFTQNNSTNPGVWKVILQLAFSSISSYTALVFIIEVYHVNAQIYSYIHF